MTTETTRDFNFNFQKYPILVTEKCKYLSIPKLPLSIKRRLQLRLVGWSLIALLISVTSGLSQNAISIENTLSGTPASEWEISGAGDLTIQGFATDLSINKGTTVDFKINVNGAVAFSIKIYRLGYYQGNGARLIVDLGSFNGMQQPNPVEDPATGLIDCGNWSITATWAVPSTAVSGLYIAKLTRSDNNGSSHIAFVVRDDSANSNILFKTSDATWQAYNGYGGNSLYTGTTGYPAGHAVKVSYNRPFMTRNGGAGGGPEEDWLFNSEYPMIRWLERNGYDVSYATDVDMDRFPSAFTTIQHKILISVGHDEYWSANERTKFEGSRNNGVHLAFFSGNEIYWKTRWENSVDGNNTPHRTLVCYKEGTLGESACGSKCDPETNIWTGLWRDGCTYSPPADGCNPENALSGQISWDGTTGFIKVPEIYKNLRFWRNAPNVSTLGSGQTWNLPDGTLGYEWNWEQYPASYPNGRMLLSATVQNGHTHKLSLYRHSSGALVFGAGTVQWAWGLDEVHDRGNEPPSTDMQQATVNLFADMGVQPASLQPGLVASVASTDNQAPSTVIISPANGSNVVSGSAVIINGTASDIGGGVVAGVEISFDGGTSWKVANGSAAWTYSWTPTTTGTMVIKSRAFDDSGNMEPAGTPPATNAITVTIEPGGSCPCSVWSTTVTPTVVEEPDPNAVELGVRIKATTDGFVRGIRFYKGPNNTGTHTGNLWTSAGINLAQVIFTNETPSGWQEMLFGAPVAISANTTYIASYHTVSGNYSVDENYFASNGVDSPPLQALANGEDGSNGVYTYSAASSFPTATFNASNYWVDVVFETSTGPDITPPVVQTASPINNASGAAISADITATFNENLAANTVNSATFELRDPSNNIVLSTISYNVGNRTAILDPSSPLDPLTLYSATLFGGNLGITDVAGNALATDYTWTFTTAASPPPPPSEGPGGPILVVSNTANPFSRYPVEILRSEGFNAFAALDISAINTTVLADYDVVILGEMPLTSGQVTLFSDWVNAGGVFIALRPDAQLGGLMGITLVGGTLSNQYLLVNTASGPGAGIVGETIQFHGTADQYSLSGATSLATLYSNATTPTTFPAVTTRNVGPNGGKSVAFTYDLARSVVYTRQGNPAWAGQERDGSSPIRSDDLFFGNNAGDPQPDWIDLDKVDIPHADEQQHLLSNIITQSNLHHKPLPRFWFLPSGHKAAVVMTGDDHGNGGTVARFNQYLALSPSNTSQAVSDWIAVRGSSYIYPGTPITNTQAVSFENQGFEIGIHLNTGCANWTPASLQNNFETQLPQLAAQLPGIAPTGTHRTHCIAWSDWASQPEIEAALGIRLDVNYYYWPGSWVQNRSGMFTGSGQPMRFAKLDGTLIDCYQVTTQMPDESGLIFPGFCDQLLDKAQGPEGFYGVFCANMHTDANNSAGSDAIIASAQARNIPVISAKQMLTWLDGRNGSSFGSIEWNVNQLSFSIAIGAGANNLRGMVPVLSSVGSLLSLSHNGNPVTYVTEVIKGVDYAFFPAASGNFVATYGVDVIPPAISNVLATPDANGTAATVNWTTNENANSLVVYGTNPSALTANASNATPTTSHSVLLTGLLPGTLYSYRVTSTDVAGNSATAPNPPAQPLTFTTPFGPCAVDATTADFSLGTSDASTVVVTDDGGAVILKPNENESFSGVSLPSNWGSDLWNAGGSITVGGGFLTAEGAHAYSTATYGPGSSIEFEATFVAGPFQNIGYSADPAFNSPWVTIGTGGSGNGVYARTSNTSDVSLGAGLLGSSHRYKIVWALSSFEFYVDGASTPATVIPFVPGSNCVVQISDFLTDGQALNVNWLRISPYPSSGSFTSRVHDAGQQRNWEEVAWTSSQPSGTTLQLFQRQGNTPVPDGTWTLFSAISANGSNIEGTSRYIQYRADLSTTNTAFTPILRDIQIACSPIPEVTSKIRVKGNNVTISNRSLTASLADHTDFGSGTTSHTFTIENLSSSQLLGLSGVPLVTIADLNANDFTVTAQPVTPIAPGGSTTFTIAFSSGSGNTRTAIVIIAHDDLPENPFIFTINGTGY